MGRDSGGQGWSALGPLRYGHTAYCCLTDGLLSVCTLNALWVHTQDSMCNNNSVFFTEKRDEKVNIIDMRRGQDRRK